MRPWQSREGSAVSYRLPLKWRAPIVSVAALTAQPLAALPPYGCGVPFTGGERHAGWHYLRHKFIGQGPQVCHSEERSDVGISCSRLRFRRGLPAIQHGTARLPRRLRLLAMTNPGASAFHSRFLYTTSPMRHTREALMKAARADGERFFTETRLEKRGNTLCTRKGHAASVRRQSRQRLRNISSFSSRWIGEKDPAAAADDFVRASQKKHAGGCI